MLSLALLIASPAAMMLAASRTEASREARLCVVVAGAPADVSADELTQGIIDGSYDIISVRPCAVPSQQDDGDDDGPDPTPRPPTKATGQWVVNPITIDPLTDDSVTATWVFANGSRSTALYVECVSGGLTQVRIFWGAFLDLQTADITSRIDDEDPVIQSWPLDALGTSSFYPTDPLAFLGSLFGKDRLVAQAKPWNQNELTLVFPITGIEGAVANVRAACDW